MKIRLALFAEYKLPHRYRFSLFDNNRKHVVKIGSEDSFLFSWYSRFMKWIDRDSRVTRHKVENQPKCDQFTVFLVKNASVGKGR